MLTPEQLAEIGADFERAHTEVGEICQRTGAGRWRMSIPARPDRDSDLIISRGLAHVEALLAEVQRLLGKLDALEEDSAKLGALETAGVDNWDGYSYAMEILGGSEG